MRCSSLEASLATQYNKKKQALKTGLSHQTHLKTQLDRQKCRYRQNRKHRTHPALDGEHSTFTQSGSFSTFPRTLFSSVSETSDPANCDNSERPEIEESQDRRFGLSFFTEVALVSGLIGAIKIYRSHERSTLKTNKVHLSLSP